MFAEKTIANKENKAPSPGKAEGLQAPSPGAQPAIQFKLAVGSPDDPMEREADRMADTVMRMPEQGFVQRKCQECEKEEQLHRKENNSSGAGPQDSRGNNGVPALTDQTAQTIQSSAGKGAAMDGQTASFMSSRFGNDFSQVRIHAGGEATQISRELSARAFTTGNDIFFNEGQYQPGSAEGKHLLAHELTHVIQQGGAQRLVSRKEEVEEDKTKALRERVLDPLRRFDSITFLSRLRNLDIVETIDLANDQEFWKEIRKSFSGSSLWSVFTILFFNNRMSLPQRKLSLALFSKNITDAMDSIAIIMTEEGIFDEDYWNMLEEVIFTVFDGDPKLSALFRMLILRQSPNSQPRKLSFSSKEVHYEKNATGTYVLTPFPGRPSMVVYATPQEFRVVIRIRFVDGLDTTKPYTFSGPKEAGITDKWRSAILNIWNNKFELANADGKLRFTVSPVFIYEDATADDTVKILNNRSLTCPGVLQPGRANESCWFSDDKTDPDTIAHEFGHLLGANDEYNLPGSAAEIPAAMKAGISPQELALTTMEGIGGTALPVSPGGHGYSIDGLMGHHYVSTEVKGRHIQLLINAFNASLPAGVSPYTIKKI